MSTDSRPPVTLPAERIRGRRALISRLAALALTVPVLFSPLRAFSQPDDTSDSVGSPGDHAPPAPRDWAGLKRDTWYFMGAQFGSLGLLYVMPEAVTNWSEDQRDNFSLAKWRENVSRPHLDKDDFYLNYILHPYWGATYYVRARERGYEKLNAFWYSAFLSTFYETGPEALFEQPSIQDLIITPVFGAWLGEYFMGVRNRVREHAQSRGYRTRGETWIWYLTDPLNLINAGVARLLNGDSRLSLQPLTGTQGTAQALHPGPMLPGRRSGSSWSAAAAGLPTGLSAAGFEWRPAHPALQRAYLADRQRLTGLSITLSW